MKMPALIGFQVAPVQDASPDAGRAEVSVPWPHVHLCALRADVDCPQSIQRFQWCTDVLGSGPCADDIDQGQPMRNDRTMRARLLQSARELLVD